MHATLLTSVLTWRRRDGRGVVFSCSRLITAEEQWIHLGHLEASINIGGEASIEWSKASEHIPSGLSVTCTVVVALKHGMLVREMLWLVDAKLLLEGCERGLSAVDLIRSILEE